MARAEDVAHTCRILGLLTALQLEEVNRSRAAQPADGRSLCQELLRRGWLTPFQVNHLFQGKGGDLTLGPYVIIDRLGKGGSGQVFRARHKVMDRVVAVKVVRPELLTDAEVVARFYREVQATSQLCHPNVVQAYDAGPFGQTHFLVMEFVDGTDLHEIVKRSGPLTEKRACNFIAQAARGLQHIHEHDLVHRDVKPSNLLLDQRHSKDGVVKVLDLGLAGLGHSGPGHITSRLTPVGSATMGTPHFLAPEQALDFSRADIRADIYSLGCTFYFLLTGQAPFGDGPLAQTLLRHQQAEPAPVPGLSPKVDQVLRRMSRLEPCRVWRCS
jgi:serine/threonine-protein kinase